MSQYVSIGERGLTVTNPMLRSIIISFLLGPARNPSLIMSLVTLGTGRQLLHLPLRQWRGGCVSAGWGHWRLFLWSNQWVKGGIFNCYVWWRVRGISGCKRGFLAFNSLEERWKASIVCSLCARFSLTLSTLSKWASSRNNQEMCKIPVAEDDSGLMHKVGWLKMGPAKWTNW